MEAQQQDPMALSAFCGAYWKPLYSYARLSGCSTEDAEDLIQNFFLRVLEKDTLANVKQDGRKMRSFLLHALKNSMRDAHRFQQAQKRGGGKQIVSFDFATAEHEISDMNVGMVSPDRCFDRAWARQVIELARERVETIYQNKNKSDQYQKLAPCLRDDVAPVNYRQVAAETNVTEATVRYWAYEIRQTFRVALREVVADTLAPGADAEQELAYLMQAFEA